MGLLQISFVANFFLPNNKRCLRSAMVLFVLLVCCYELYQMVCICPGLFMLSPHHKLHQQHVLIMFPCESEQDFPYEMHPGMRLWGHKHSPTQLYRVSPDCPFSRMARPGDAHPQDRRAPSFHPPFQVLDIIQLPNCCQPDTISHFLFFISR